MDNKLDFADLLKKYMARSKITAQELADKIGIDRRAIAGHRAGTFRPKCDNAVKMAEILRLTPLEIKEFLKAISQECFKSQFSNVSDPWAATIFPEFTPKLLQQISLMRPPIILLLTQAGWDEPPCREALLIQANKRYRPERVFHIVPPVCSDHFDNYFSVLAQQCNFKKVANDADFEGKLEELCRSSREEAFLLISRFEQIPNIELQHKFAGIIRSLTERYKNIHVILCGNQQLERLKFENGVLSLLNVASIERWPELGKTEVLALRDHYFPELKLTDDDVTQILKFSGGHPKLLHECLKIKQKSKNFNLEKCHELLDKNEHIWQSFIPYLNDLRKPQILKWLERDDVGQKEPFIINELLRELYWKNLLVNRDEQLCWRCRLIRMIGRKVLAR